MEENIENTSYYDLLPADLIKRLIRFTIFLREENLIVDQKHVSSDEIKKFTRFTRIVDMIIKDMLNLKENCGDYIESLKGEKNLDLKEFFRKNKQQILDFMRNGNWKKELRGLGAQLRKALLM
ncbi:MAG: hypothetical protein ACFFCS_15715 [Candidatus Hodarchaeota archaeon]